MGVVVDFLLGLAILAGAYVWVKKKFLQPGIPQEIDISNVRGVPLVKKAHPPVVKAQDVEPVAEPPVDTGVPPVAVAVEPAAQIEISEVEAVAAVESSAESAQVCPPAIPEDSVLKRHYLAQREAERLNLSNPYPSDSVLRRHHESALSALFEQSKQCLQFDAKGDVEASGGGLVTESIQTSLSSPIVPEDSVLKRHYLQLIQSRSAAN